MRNAILTMLLLTGTTINLSCGFIDDAQVTQTQSEDQQAIQAFRDLGLSPEMALEIVKNGLEKNAEAPASPEVQETQDTADNQPVPQDVSESPLRPAEQQVAVASPQVLPPPVPQAPVAMVSAPAPVPTVTASPAIMQATAITPPAPVLVVAAPEVTTVADFEGSLSPYGTWVNVYPYGRVWQPVTTVTSAAWRPYCHGGNWVFTDGGWYWRSDYSWGWAPFHYGRWVYTSAYRWVWIPDTVWAPAWVQWRSSDAYVGWAPLPPAAHYEPGIGFSYCGQHVAFSFEFGLGDADYMYVPAGHCMDRDVYRNCASRDERARIHRETRVVQQTYTRENVTVPGLPSHVAVNAGRRSTEIQKIVRTVSTGTSAAPIARQVTRATAPAAAAPHAEAPRVPNVAAPSHADARPPQTQPADHQTVTRGLADRVREIAGRAPAPETHPLQTAAPAPHAAPAPTPARPPVRAPDVKQDREGQVSPGSSGRGIADTVREIFKKPAAPAAPAPAPIVQVPVRNPEPIASARPVEPQPRQKPADVRPTPERATHDAPANQGNVDRARQVTERAHIPEIVRAPETKPVEVEVRRAPAPTQSNAKENLLPRNERRGDSDKDKDDDSDKSKNSRSDRITKNVKGR